MSENLNDLNPDKAYMTANASRSTWTLLHIKRNETDGRLIAIDESQLVPIALSQVAVASSMLYGIHLSRVFQRITRAYQIIRSATGLLNSPTIHRAGYR